jgi:hypothetical protein
MKELRGLIVEEQNQLAQLVSIVLKNESGQVEVKKKKKQDLDNLVSNFKNAGTLEEKIKLWIRCFFSNLRIFVVAWKFGARA